MRYGHQSKPGWACVLRASDLGSVLSGPNRNDLLNHINEGSPIYIELEGKGDLNALLEWLVFLKDAGVRTPIVLLAVINHRDWGEEIVRLLDIPGSRLLTSGSTIGSLSTIVSYLRNKGESWSNRLIFASSYPETQIGESLSEILSYFLSKGLGATSDDLQRILGGNLISLLPPRPRFLKYIINESTVAAEGLLGKTSMNELSRILRILATRGIQQVLSCDFMPLRNGAEIDLRSAVLTVKESTSNEANSLGLLSERNESLRVAGWMNTFKETLVERKADLLLSLIRTSTKAGGPILNSPSQLNRFNYSLLECLKVRNPHEILSALHFEVQIGDNLRGSISIHPDDLVALESADNQLLIGLEATTGQWWASKASSHPECPTRTVQLSREDARVLGIKELAVIDLVKYEGEVQDLQKARLAFNSDNASASELMAYIHLHHEEIEGTLNEFYLGRGTTLSFGGPFSVKMTLANTEPPLEQGQVGILNSERIILHPDQFYQPMNVVLCISTDSSMQEKDIELRAMEAFRRSLQDVKWDVPELNQFLDSIGSQPTRAQISALAALLVLSGLSGNRTDGRLALVTYSDRARKFSVQKADRLLNYIEFATDFASEEVLVSILYSILDTVDETGGKSKPAAMFRSLQALMTPCRCSALRCFSSSLRNFSSS